MMHGDEKSDPAIVAVKPANKSGQLCSATIKVRKPDDQDERVVALLAS
jgi:hypothetical protein